MTPESDQQQPESTEPAATGKGGGVSVDAIHRALRSQILDGSIAPGTMLSQVELADRFGVSRTPLREALRMLQEEGLIEARSNRQARVVTFALADLEAISAQRMLLSALATQVSVPWLTEEQLQELADLMEIMVKSGEAGDRVAWREADTAFHAGHSAYASANLFQEVRRLAERNSLYRLVWSRDEPHRDPLTVTEHERILLACRARDPQEAAKAVARHQARIALGVLAQSAPEHEPRVIRASLQMIIGSASPIPHPQN